jgi:hypothetical protein
MGSRSSTRTRAALGVSRPSAGPVSSPGRAGAVLGSEAAGSARNGPLNGPRAHSACDGEPPHPTPPGQGHLRRACPPRRSIASHRMRLPRYCRRMELVRRYWGYDLVVLLILLLSNGEWDPTVILVLAGATAVYFFFQVPLLCGATTRDGTACRNNSRGLLFGCNQFRQHKMQVFKAAIVPRTVHELQAAYWANPGQRVASIGAFSALLATLIALVALIIKWSETLRPARSRRIQRQSRPRQTGPGRPPSPAPPVSCTPR